MKISTIPLQNEKLYACPFAILRPEIKKSWIIFAAKAASEPSMQGKLENDDTRLFTTRDRRLQLGVLFIDPLK